MIPVIIFKKLLANLKKSPKPFLAKEFWLLMSNRQLAKIVKEINNEDFYYRYRKWIDWDDLINFYFYSDLDFIKQHIHRMRNLFIDYHNILTEEVFEKNPDKVDWFGLERNENISDEFIAKHCLKMGYKPGERSFNHLLFKKYPGLIGNNLGNTPKKFYQKYNFYFDSYFETERQDMLDDLVNRFQMFKIDF